MKFSIKKTQIGNDTALLACTHVDHLVTNDSKVGDVAQFEIVVNTIFSLSLSPSF